MERTGWVVSWALASLSALACSSAERADVGSAGSGASGFEAEAGADRVEGGTEFVASMRAPSADCPVDLDSAYAVGCTVEAKCCSVGGFGFECRDAQWRFISYSGSCVPNSGAEEPPPSYAGAGGAGAGGIGNGGIGGGGGNP